MSVRVNLLPDDLQRKEQADRRNLMIGGAFVVLLVVIAGVYWLQLMDANAAQAELDEEQETLQALQAELASLQEYEELRSLREEANEVLQSALAGEASVAGILQDIASVMPPDAQLDSLTINVTGETEAELGDLRPYWGTVTVTGQTRLGHAPGLERFLLEFDKIAAFSDLYFSNSTVDERGVSTFNADLDLGPEVLTGRYANGLPEELR